eukprot:COSAG04_NODE_13700_length_595_cov_0.766129_1_plen_89_part_00
MVGVAQSAVKAKRSVWSHLDGRGGRIKARDKTRTAHEEEQACALVGSGLPDLVAVHVDGGHIVRADVDLPVVVAALPDRRVHAVVVIV